MSIKLMNAVWDLDLAQTEKIVLLSLADQANDEGVCWPYIATLVKRCGSSERTIRRVISKLESAGYLTVENRHNRSSVFTIHPVPVEAYPANLTGQPDRSNRPVEVTGQPDTSRPVTVAPLTGHCDRSTGHSGTPIRTTTNHQLEPPSEPPRQTQIEQLSSVYEVFGHWQTVWNHPKAELDNKRRARIRARLNEGLSVEQLCQAISGFRHSPWHNGTDPKGNGIVYDGVETLLRDRAQVEKGLQWFTRGAPPERPRADWELSPIERFEREQQRQRGNSDERVVASYREGERVMEGALGDVRGAGGKGVRKLGT